MRISEQQAQIIHQIVQEATGGQATVRLFGSRLDDAARGGDLDLLVELPTAVDHPAALTARLSARISRFMDGRSVDILLLAPNLRRLPIHDVALREGTKL
jgi:predicted nucleotidyltransferase